MIKVTKIENFDGRLVIRLYTKDRFLVLEKVLKYLFYSDALYFYLFFGYHEYNFDMDRYYEKYLELKNEHGFISIIKQDALDPIFISQVLLEYQMASIFINETEGMEKTNDFKTIRDRDSIKNGYEIYMHTDYEGEDAIVLSKGVDMPEWDLEKLGICI